MRIALISDSHGRLPGALWSHLDGVDEILHLGDLGPTALLADLCAAAPILAVAGNVDPPGLPELPALRRIERGGIAIHMRHHPWRAGELGMAGAALYLHGHTHVPSAQRSGEAWILCPGALHAPRGGHPATLGLLELSGEGARLRILPLEGGGRLVEENLYRF